jgi:periplasmic divalent cation tolerance protein
MNLIQIIQSTFQSKKEAFHVAQELLKKKKACCCQLQVVESLFMWKKKEQSEKEWRLIIKTLPEHKTFVSTFIKSHHSYERPEILFTQWESEKEYFQWCHEECSN